MIESDLLEQTQGFINGQWTGTGNKATFTVKNPATGTPLAQVPDMGAAETDRAVEAALHVLASPSDAEQRTAWLQSIYELLIEYRQELARIITMEHGKSLQQSSAEVEYAAGFFAYYASVVPQLEATTLQEKIKDCEWRIYSRPVGVAALISPWNFPIAMLAKKLAAAIAADCAPIIKPSSKTPLTAIAFVSLLQQNLPECAQRLQLLVGDAQTIGDALCFNDHVHMISFTGSTRIGQQLIEKCAPQIKKLSLELGGNAPFVVFDDADIELAVNELIGNKTRGSGQTCVCTNRVLLQEGIAGEFIEQLNEKLNKLVVDNGIFEKTDIGPLIDGNAHRKVRAHLLDALEKGAQLRYGEDPGELKTSWGAFFPPIVLTQVTEDMSCVRDEVFGPLIPIMTVSDTADAIAKANATSAGLAAYVFTGNEQVAQQLLPQLKFGYVGINTATGPIPQTPFGGMKRSGLGREGGVEGLLEFIEAQTVASR